VQVQVQARVLATWRPAATAASVLAAWQEATQAAAVLAAWRQAVTQAAWVVLAMTQAWVALEMMLTGPWVLPLAAMKPLARAPALQLARAVAGPALQAWALQLLAALPVEVAVVTRAAALPFAVQPP
jgi:hypothetical protein